MKRIMFFGDSNTWGYEPVTGERYGEDIRFTGKLIKALPDCRIIEEGLKARTTAFDDSLATDRNGLKTLPMLLSSHTPLDLVVIMLGTNDVKRRFHVSAEEIAQGVERLVKTVHMPLLWGGKKLPKILIVCPPGVTANFKGTDLEGEFDDSSIEKSQQLDQAYRAVADKYECEYLNAMEFTGPGVSDGVHLEAVEHQRLADALEVKIREVLDGMGE